MVTATGHQQRLHLAISEDFSMATDTPALRAHGERSTAGGPGLITYGGGGVRRGESDSGEKIYILYPAVRAR